nr:MbcA/ParS/Xre antitoxin family protein [uncultured Desulfuromonas sp.]
MTSSIDSIQGIDLTSTDSRVRLTQLIIRLFELWELSDEDQAALLGLSAKSRTTLNRYRRGSPMANSMDLIDRAGYLLSIHRSLRILYPRNRNLAYAWISKPNKRFNNKSPLSVIKEKHFGGLLAISRYLDWELNH